MADKVEKVNFGQIGPPPNWMKHYSMVSQTNRRGEVLSKHCLLLTAKTCTSVLIILAPTVLADETVLSLCLPRPKHSTAVLLYR